MSKAHHSRAKWRRGSRIQSLQELATYFDVMRKLGHDRDSLVFYHSTWTRRGPMSWKWLKHMQTRNIIESIERGMLYFAVEREKK